MQSCETLRLVLGDQLNHAHPWWKRVDKKTLYVFMETRSETDYARHHIQKVIGFFLAMRHFAGQMKAKGHRVLYLRLDDERNRQSIVANIRWLVDAGRAHRFEYQLPDEYRLDEALRRLAEELPVPASAVDTHHFLSERDELARLFRGKKTYLMETFYRAMRRKYQLLMEADGETPLSGRWNFDQENRKKLPPDVEIPAPLLFSRQVHDLVDMLRRAGVATIGRIDPDRYSWPLNREEALELLEHFAERRLRRFGAYQDAMTTRDSWLFHSRLSFALNLKLLHPLEVARAAIERWERHPQDMDIAQVEGFVRQIIGWREYMRGVYWAKMPAYKTLNYFDHQAPLPKFYWTGETKMNCLRHAVNQSLDEAYAHHIQRLMLTGNFALLLGVHPDAVDEWYLGIYQDAVEWVEITNTRGMSQYADGGMVSTKPYVSSANYIHKMSDYCVACVYDHRKKHGQDACPFNSLYWDFFERHADKLDGNPRIGMMYRTWEKMPARERENLLRQAERYKKQADEL
jgi:deoxyribodipyrimidine photolyase-related protein